MRHRLGFKQLSRSSSQRKSLLRSQVTSLLSHEKIITTAAKAHATRRLAEKVITRAKNANAEIIRLTDEGSDASIERAKGINVHAHRMVSRYVYTEEVIAKLFNQIAPLFANRNGGYTRILKLSNRANDAAELVVLELVEHTEQDVKEEKKKDKKEKKVSVKSKQAVSRANENKIKKIKSAGEGVRIRQKKGDN